MRSDMPPEAYSKEMLSEAFNWLQTQPESVREIVQTPEHLVALYRKHQGSFTNNDAPVSSKQFVSELKDLAKGLDQFSDSPATTAPEMFERSTPAPTPKNEVMPSTLKQPNPPYIEPQRKKTESLPQVQVDWDMDDKTKGILRETARRFNLSGEAEALRMLVALGYEKISKI